MTGVEFTVAFDEICNLLYSQKIEDIKVMVDGMKDNPVRFIYELMDNLDDHIKQQAAEKNLCPVCLTSLDTGVNRSDYGSSTAYESYSICPNCEV